MTFIKRRNNDNEDDRGYKSRRLLDTKAIMLIIAALVGGGTTNGVINLSTNNAHEEISKIDDKVNSYIEHQKEITLYRNQLLEQQFNEIKLSLARIEKEIERMKKDGK